MENSLAVLDAREQGLIKLANDLKGLTISGLEDREGFLKVSEARKSLKSERVQIEKDAKQLRDSAVKFQKAVIAREKELIGIIEPTENELYQEEEKYKKLKAEQEREKEKQAIQKTQDRVNKLAKFGKAMDYFELKHLSDERFNEIATQAEIDFNTEQEKIAQEKAEAERLRAEEYERLRAERIALDLQKAEQERKERELRQQDIERVEAERRRQEDIKAETDRIQKEREELEREKRQHEEQIRLEKAKKEAAERARIEEQERIKREEKEKIERERLAKAEAERQEALKPDKDKLMQYAHNLMSVAFPDLIHDDAKKISDGVKSKVVQVVAQIQKTANGL